MKELLKTTLLEYDKSTFLIDLVRHAGGQLYIEVNQTIYDGRQNISSQGLKINPTILDDLIQTLSFYQQQLPKANGGIQTYFSAERKEELKRRYYKGLSVRDLALQFDCPHAIVEQILVGSGIEIVSNEMPKRGKKTRYTKSKRR